jgi:signal transduction histidine kinase
MDLMVTGPESLDCLSKYKIFDYVISQKLSKNIIIRLLCPFDEDRSRLLKHIVPFIGYRSIKPSLPKSSSNSLLFIGDKQNIFSFSVNAQRQSYQDARQGSNTIFSLDNWSYSKDISLVRNSVYCFDLIWEEKEINDKIIKEKKHSELLFDLLSHDIGNYHQIVQNSLEIVTALTKENKKDTDISSDNDKEIFSFIMTATKAIDKSQSLLNNVRRLERLYTQKDLKLVSKNLPDAINNAYNTLKQSLYEHNPQGKTIKFSLNIIDNQNNNAADINIDAEDLLEEIFINLFSNSVKYSGSAEVKIDVMIREYFIAEIKYWMVTVSDNGNGIPDSMKKEMFDRFYSQARGTGLGLSIVRTLVERYKGKIWVGDRVYEDYKQGTVFGMIFPTSQ